MRHKEAIETLAVLILVVLDVWGWWTTLILWTIPTASAPIGSLSALTLVAIALFFTGWLAAMIWGVIFLIAILLGTLQ
jgi:hypothetical protein